MVVLRGRRCNVGLALFLFGAGSALAIAYAWRGMLCDMLTTDSRAALEQFLEERGIDAATVTPVSAVQAVLDWYQTQPIDGLDARMGDMLLFQWGSYDLGRGPLFHFDLVRQMIVDDEEGDDAIWQLHFTLRYPPDDALATETHWCDSLDDVADFRSAILRNTTVEQIAERHPDSIEILLELAG